MASDAFAALLVRWQRQHGRHDLPWQGSRDPYRVWLSEIMLQQTQVATVKAYYARFLAQFPDVASLARAHEDTVLGLWSGLGYYSRARNLHRCAQQVVAHHGGEFPRDAATLATLPGIGRSTAAAIASVCFGQRVSILDANARRVVARVCGFGGDLAQAAQERALWAAAEELLPVPAAAQDMPTYTQGMMDLGALLCTPRRPGCAACPVAAVCRAHIQGQQEALPVRTRKLQRSSLALHLLWLRTPSGQVWLLRRPARGIWAGLHCLPVWENPTDLQAALGPARASALEVRPVVRHALTHRDLYLHPCVLNGPQALEVAAALAAAGAVGRWWAQDQWPALGLPAPVRRLLEEG